MNGVWVVGSPFFFFFSSPGRNNNSGEVGFFFFCHDEFSPFVGEGRGAQEQLDCTEEG